MAKYYASQVAQKAAGSAIEWAGGENLLYVVLSEVVVPPSKRHWELTALLFVAMSGLGFTRETGIEKCKSIYSVTSLRITSRPF